MDGSDRVQEVLPRAVDALIALLDAYEVTPDEWLGVLRLLTEVGQNDEFVLLSDVLRVSVHLDARMHAGLPGTASNVEGPFYLGPGPELRAPYELGAGLDGPRLLLSGEVRDTDGIAIADAEIDVWQSDGRGLYDHQDDAIPDGALRGRLRTDLGGRYELDTVMPAPYQVKNDGPVGRLLERLGRHAFRPAHIHIKVRAPGHETLTTMVFFEGDPWLESDTIDAVKEPLVLAARPDDAGQRSARFDIVMREKGGT